jgi:hypothetical protein
MEFIFGSGISGQFVRPNHTRHVLQPFEEGAKAFLGLSFVTLTLNEDSKHNAVLSDSVP